MDLSTVHHGVHKLKRKKRVARGIGGRLTEEFTRTLDRTRLSLTG